MRNRAVSRVCHNPRTQKGHVPYGGISLTTLIADAQILAFPFDMR